MLYLNSEQAVASTTSRLVQAKTQEWALRLIKILVAGQPFELWQFLQSLHFGGTSQDFGLYKMSVLHFSQFVRLPSVEQNLPSTSRLLQSVQYTLSQLSSSRKLWCILDHVSAHSKLFILSPRVYPSVRMLKEASIFSVTLWCPRCTRSNHSPRSQLIR